MLTLSFEVLITLTSLPIIPDLLVLAERDGILPVLAVLVVLPLVLDHVLRRVRGRRRRGPAASAVIGIVGEELPEIAGVVVGELLGDQSLVQRAYSVAPLASPWPCNNWLLK